MSYPRVSEVSFSSDLAEELDQNAARDDWELYEIADASTKTPSQAVFLVDEEDQHLLDINTEQNRERSRCVTIFPTQNSHSLTSSRSTASPRTGKLAKAREFLHARDLTTTAGRQQLKKDLTRSGPVARVDTDPQPAQNSGL